MRKIHTKLSDLKLKQKWKTNSIHAMVSSSFAKKGKQYTNLNKSGTKLSISLFRKDRTMEDINIHDVCIYIKFLLINNEF